MPSLMETWLPGACHGVWKQSMPNNSWVRVPLRRWNSTHLHCKFILESSLRYFFKITRNFYFLFKKNNLFLAIFVEMSDFREENCFNRNYNTHLWILDWSHVFFGCCKWSQNPRNTVSSNIDAASVGRNQSVFVEHNWYKTCEQGWEAVIGSGLLNKHLLSVHRPLCWGPGPGPEGATEGKTVVPALRTITATTGVREGRLFTKGDDSFCCNSAGKQTLLNQRFETS